jgi:hypothetical protein
MLLSPFGKMPGMEGNEEGVSSGEDICVCKRGIIWGPCVYRILIEFSQSRISIWGYDWEFGEVGEQRGV